MELNREQIEKALDCFHHRILNTKLAEKVTEGEMMAVINALALIKELAKEVEEWKDTAQYYRDGLAECQKSKGKLAEENERLREENEIKSQKRANIFEITNAFERGRTDGVQKLQERFIAELRKDGRMNYYIRKVLDQTAKEMLEGQNEK